MDKTDAKCTNSGRGYLIRSLNIRSLSNKISLLEADIQDRPDVIAIQETWLNASHCDASLKIDGYSIVRRDRQGQRGGGLAFYISDRVGWSIPDIVSDTVECNCVDIHEGSHTVRLCNVYRPPNEPVLWYDRFERLLESVTSCKFVLFIVGDFNIDFLCERSSRKLSSIFSSFDMSQYVEHSTRSTQLSQSCIDLFFSRHTNRLKVSSIDLLTPIADHCQVNVRVGRPLKSPCIQKVKWLYDQCDFLELNRNIYGGDWAFLDDSNKSVNEICDNFLDKLNALFVRFIPTCKYTLRPEDKPWMTSEIRQNQRQRDRIHKKARISNLVSDWNRYRVQKNLTNRLIRDGKKHHDSTIIDLLNDQSQSGAAWWRVVKTAFGSSRETIPALKSSHSGQSYYATDNATKANMLNDIFVDVTNVNDANCVFPDQHPRSEARLQYLSITPNDVSQAINSLGPNKAPGPDSFTPKLLKGICPSISPLLAQIFNKSLDAAEFPVVWKDANVVPIFKKGSRSDPQNYRPISLTSILSKVFEKAVLGYMLPKQ